MNSDIWMAIFDYIPVLFFLCSGILVQHYLKRKISLHLYIFLLIGIIIVFLAGFSKATHKVILKGLDKDITLIITLFLPFQSFGSILYGLSVFCSHYSKFFIKKFFIIYIFTPILIVIIIFSNRIVYIIILFIGFSFLTIGLTRYAYQKDVKVCVVLYILSFLANIAMGAISNEDFESSVVTWIAEGINTLGQLLFLYSTFLLYRIEMRNESNFNEKERYEERASIDPNNTSIISV